MVDFPNFGHILGKLKAYHDGHFTFSIVSCWDTCSDVNIKSCTMVSFDAVCACSPVLIMLQSEQTEFKKI